MTIVVNPHNQQEEQQLLAFLDSMKYEYVQDDLDDGGILTAAQKAEILERDRLYEAGEMEVYTFDEVLTFFNNRKK